MTENYFVYIMSNIHNNVLYVGVTSNLVKRVYQHREKLVEGFTKKYNICKLVHYEIFEDANYAIEREKQLKKRKREKKEEIINNSNPMWDDLYMSLQ